MNNSKLIALGLALTMVLGAALGWFIKPDKYARETGTEFQVKLKYDTVFVEQPPVSIKAAKPKIIYRDKIDTIVKESFTATVDTVVLKDTIRFSYNFPENIFTDIYFKPAPMPTITVTKTETQYKERSWWEIPLYIVTGVGTGFLIGKATTK